MANWTGTYSITNGATGTSTGGNSSTELRNTGATWPTGAQSLANFTVRILSGTGAGQSRIVTSNTVTVLTVPAWMVTPDATSTYEIVLVFNAAGSDHIVAAVVLSTNIVTEITDSSTLLFDGVYTLSFGTNCIVRWGKSLETMPTLCANNRTVQGKTGFWNYVYFLATLTVTPQFSFIKIQDAANGLIVAPSIGAGDCSTITKVWIEGASTQVSLSGAVMPVDVKLSGIYWRNCPVSGVTYPSTLSPGRRCIVEKCWAERGSTGLYTFSATGATEMTWRDNVAFEATSNRNVNIGAGQTAYVLDSYFSSRASTDVIIAGASSVAGAGTYVVRNNRSQTGRAIYGAANSTASIASAFNDWASNLAPTYEAFDIAAASNYVSATSDNDFIAGCKTASPENIDTTMSTTSTASPAQYKNLTAARTNARSTPNKPFTMDNVVIGTPTGDAVTITFDCANGVQAGQGSTTVSADSASGQKTLNVAGLVGLAAGDTIEIGYGTPRFEVARVASVTTTVNVESNLTYTHTAAQADTVRKQLRHDALPIIRYGTAPGIYNMESYLPPAIEWGLLWTGIKTSVDGHACAWKRVGHSVTLANLSPETTYYFKVCGVNPLGETLESVAEYSFTTAANTKYSDLNPADVTLGVAWQYNSNTSNRVGTRRDVVPSMVKHDVVFGPNDSLTGTYDGSDRWTDPGDNNVRYLTTYKANSLTTNKTGRTVLPIAPTVSDGTGYDTDGLTLGTLVSPSSSVIANAVIDALNAAMLPVNLKQINDAEVIGDGTPTEPWRGNF